MKIRLTEAAALFAVPLAGYAMVYGFVRGQSAHLEMDVGFERVLNPQTILSFVIPAIGIVLFLSLCFVSIRHLAAKAGPVLRVFVAVIGAGLIVLPLTLHRQEHPERAVIGVAAILVAMLLWQFMIPIFKGGTKNYLARLDAEWRPTPREFSITQKYVYLLLFFMAGFMLSEISGSFTAAIRVNYGYYCEKNDFVVVRHYDDGLVVAPLDIESKVIKPNYKWVEKATLRNTICAGPIGPLQIS